MRSGRLDVCIAIGALTDLSYWELLGLRAMGAMVPECPADAPEQACRPFDARRSGFVFGEACAAIVVERAGLRDARAEYCTIAGWSVRMDGHRGPDPSLRSEVDVIRGALAHAQLSPSQIDYVNPHGSGSKIGDLTELDALRACELTHVTINATKSLTGHGLAAAGAVEAVATILQMKAARAHPTRNLQEPIDSSFRWVREHAIDAELRNCLSLSFGFGGINTALCFRAREPGKGWMNTCHA